MAKIDYRGALNYISELLQKKLKLSTSRARGKTYRLSSNRKYPPQDRFARPFEIYPVSDATHLKTCWRNTEPITPRLYSIASRPKRIRRVHITVARDKFRVNGEVKYACVLIFFASR